MIARLVFGFSLAVFACDNAFAEDSAAPPTKSNAQWVDPGWRSTLSRYYVKFDDRGLSTTTVEFEYLALSEKGAAAIAQETFGYNSYFKDLSVGELETVKANGATIAVDEKAIRDQPRSTDTTSPYFDEQRVKTVAYPDVAAGDKIKGRLTFTSKQAEFPGEFASYWAQNLSEPPGVMDLTVDVPADRSLQIAARGVEPTQEKKGDRLLYHVVFTQTDPRPLKDKTDSFDDARRFEVSTFADYQAFAAAMNARNAPMAVPDEAIKNMSVEIVGDAKKPGEQVKRIHNWVAQHIRYVGIGFEDGGWTAQPASATLSVRYGDCKAHATLLKALLAAQGIEANLVAVNLAERFTLTQVATPNFDHAIVYVPSLGIYLDPTSSLTAYGALPSSLYGKPVLNIDTGLVSTIPVQKPDDFVITSKTDYTLEHDGTRQAKTSIEATGVGATILREMARYGETVNSEELAKTLLEAANLKGSGSYEFANPRELGDSYGIAASFALSDPVKLDAPARTSLAALEDKNNSFLRMIAGEDRARSFRCSPVDYTAEDSLTIPPGSHFYEVPGPLALKKNLRDFTGYGAVDGAIEMNGNAVLGGDTVRAHTHVRVTFSAPICPESFSSQLKSAFKKYDQFRTGLVGLTPRPVSRVIEGGPDYYEAIRAYETRDYATAANKFLELAGQNNIAAIYYLGWMYEKGLGEPQDDRQAVFWYKKGSDLGDSLAQAKLGYRYMNGIGVQQDYQQAFQLFRAAAEKGDKYGQFDLGESYTKGQGSPVDYKLAMDSYLKSAAQGYAPAQYRVAYLYENGFGVPCDAQQAIEWYKKAADQQYPDAKARVADLSNPARKDGICSSSTQRIIEQTR